MVPTSEPRDGVADAAASQDTEERLVDLEIRAEHQERTTQDLDAVLLEFTRRVERIEQEVADIRAELLKMSGDDPGRPF